MIDQRRRELLGDLSRSHSDEGLRADRGKLRIVFSIKIFVCLLLELSSNFKIKMFAQK